MMQSKDLVETICTALASAAPAIGGKYLVRELCKGIEADSPETQATALAQLDVYATRGGAALRQIELSRTTRGAIADALHSRYGNVTLAASSLLAHHPSLLLEARFDDVLSVRDKFISHLESEKAANLEAALCSRLSRALDINDSQGVTELTDHLLDCIRGLLKSSDPEMRRRVRGIVTETAIDEIFDTLPPDVHELLASADEA